jgi:hypothetical protein
MFYACSASQHACTARLFFLTLERWIELEKQLKAESHWDEDWNEDSPHDPSDTSRTLAIAEPFERLSLRVGHG